MAIFRFGRGDGGEKVIKRHKFIAQEGKGKGPKSPWTPKVCVFCQKNHLPIWREKEEEEDIVIKIAPTDKYLMSDGVQKKDANVEFYEKPRGKKCPNVARGGTA